MLVQNLMAVGVSRIRTNMIRKGSEAQIAEPELVYEAASCQYLNATAKYLIRKLFGGLYLNMCDI